MSTSPDCLFIVSWRRITPGERPYLLTWQEAEEVEVAGGVAIPKTLLKKKLPSLRDRMKDFRPNNQNLRFHLKKATEQDQLKTAMHLIVRIATLVMYLRSLIIGYQKYSSFSTTSSLNLIWTLKHQDPW
jgi:hypothetical protein